jgi:hypothetical protein
MSYRKTGLTMEQHRDIGRRLKAVRKEILALQSELVKAYPITDGFERRLLSITNHLDHVRSRAEDRMFQAHGDAGSLDVYYGTTC